MSTVFSLPEAPFLEVVIVNITTTLCPSKYSGVLDVVLVRILDLELGAQIVGIGNAPKFSRHRAVR